MNRIYKVLWNQALGCYCAVSELAKAHTKSAAKAVCAAVLSAAAASAYAMTVDNPAYLSQTNSDQYDDIYSTGTEIEGDLDISGKVIAIGQASWVNVLDNLNGNSDVAGKTKITFYDYSRLFVNNDAVLRNSILSAPILYNDILFETKNNFSKLGKDDEFYQNLLNGQYEDQYHRVTEVTMNFDGKLDLIDSELEAASNSNITVVSGLSATGKSRIDVSSTFFSVFGGFTAIGDGYSREASSMGYFTNYSVKHFLRDNSDLSVVGDFYIKDLRISLTRNSKLSISGNALIDNSELISESELADDIEAMTGKTSALSVAKDLTIKGDKDAYKGNTRVSVNDLEVEGKTTVSDNAVLNVNKYTSNEALYLNYYPEIKDENRAKGWLTDLAVKNGSAFEIGCYTDVHISGDADFSDDSGLSAEIKSTVSIDGSLKTSSSKVSVDKNSALNVGSDFTAQNTVMTLNSAELNIGRNLNFANKELSGIDYSNLSRFQDSKINVQGVMNLANVYISAGGTDISVKGDITVDNARVYAGTDDSGSAISSIRTDGNLIVKGTYNEETYDPLKPDSANYFTAAFSANSLSVKGDISLTDNAQLLVENYSWSSLPDPNDKRPELTEGQRVSSSFGGIIKADRHSRFGVYNGADANLSGTVNLASGSALTVWGDAGLNLSGVLTASGKDTMVQVGEGSSADISGRMMFRDGAELRICSDTTRSDLSVNHNPSKVVNRGDITVGAGSAVIIEKDSTLEVTSKDGKLTLVKGAKLETAAAGAVKVSAGGTVTADKDTLLKGDLSGTASGVAEKTFELDSFSRLAIKGLGKVSTDEAQRIRSSLVTDDNGILDIVLDVPVNTDGKTDVSEALKASGTTAFENAAVANVDTGSSTLDEQNVLGGVLSWGSAELASGQENLNLGSAKLELNKAGTSGMFVVTSEGKAGNVTMTEGGSLSLNGSGAIGSITGPGSVLLGQRGTDAPVSVTAANIGTEAAPLTSLSVGSSLASKADLTVNSVYAQELIVGSGSVTADRIRAKKVIVGTPAGASGAGAAGSLSVGTLNLLAGGLIYGDPEYGTQASFEAIGRLSAEDVNPSYDGSDRGVLNGTMVSGRNNVLAIGFDSRAQAVNAVTSLGLLDSQFSLSEKNVSSALVLNRRVEVLDGTANRIVVDKAATLENIDSYTADVTLGDNAGLIITGRALADAAASGKGVISLDRNNAKVSVSAGSESKARIYISGNDVSRKLLNGARVFDNANRSSAEALVENAENTEIVIGSGLYSGGSLGSDGKVYNVAVNYAGISALPYASAPVKGIITAAAENYDRRDGQGAAFIFDNAVTSGGRAAELAARLAPASGAYQAAKSVLESNASSLASRFGIGSHTVSVSQSGSTALWGTVNLSRNRTDGFGAEGVNYGSNIKTYGGILGADYTLNDTVTLGGYFSIGKGDADGRNGGANDDIRYRGAGLYASFSVGEKLTVLSDVSYTLFENRMSADFGLKGKADMKALSAGVTAKYDYALAGGYKVSPYAGVRVNRYSLDDYSTSSAMYGTVSAYSADSLTVLSVPAGVTVSKEFAVAEWKLIPAFDMSAAYSSKKEASGSVQFTGMYGSTALKTQVMDRFTYGASAKLEAVKGNARIGLGLKYTGSSCTKEVGAQLNASYLF